MDDEPKKVRTQMTVIEAQEKLEQFKQKLIDDHYKELIEDGESKVDVSFELLEALDVILYYVYSMSEVPADPELD